MFQFPKINDLITHFSQCVMCQTPREIEFVFDLADNITVDSSVITDKTIELRLTYTEQIGSEDELPDGAPAHKVVIPLAISIDILNNTFSCRAENFVNALGEWVHDTSGLDLAFSFNIEACCMDCRSYVRTEEKYINTSDSSEYLSEFKVDVESFYLVKSDERYKITYDPDVDFMTVQRLRKIKPVKTSKFKQRFARLGKPIHLPRFKFDFSDEARVIAKLKTYITFS